MPRKRVRGRGGLRRGGRGDNGDASSSQLYRKKRAQSRRTESSNRSLRALDDWNSPQLGESAQYTARSFSFYSKRPGYDNSGSRLQPRRHVPIEFTKAKEVYDPSADYFKSMKVREKISDEQVLLNILEESEAQRLEVETNPNKCGASSYVVREENAHSEDVPTIDRVNMNSQPDDSTSNTSVVEEKDGQVTLTLEDKSTVGINCGNSDTTGMRSTRNTDGCSTNLHDKATLATLQSASNTNVMNDVQNKMEDCNIELDTSSTDSESSSDNFDDHEDGDLLSSEYLAQLDPNNLNSYVHDITSRMQYDYTTSDDDFYISDTNFDEMAPQLPGSEDGKEISSVGDSDADIMDFEEKQEEGDPKYGFLDVDYDFDCSTIEVRNVRLGITNSLHVKCSALTGVHDDFVWIDQGDVEEYALTNGVKEHRLDAFLDFITNGSIHATTVSESDDDSVYVSETSDESDQDLEQGFGDEMECVDSSIQDLIASQKRLMAGTRNVADLQPTSSLSTRGKGRKKRLALEGLSCDQAIKEALQKQFANKHHSHRAKRQEKAESDIMRAIANHDLCVKYPYSLHIDEMILEIRDLLNDSLRSTLSFPPLDSHGLKTIKQIATAFGMSFGVCGGNGKHQYAKVSQRKNSHKYMNEDLLRHVRRGRPVFQRKDQRRPREEVIVLGTTTSNREKARKRNAEQNTVYRDGEIVGATAPQIDDNNIGRQLLLRLGWVHGEGLGVHGNKGISEPVMAKVKKTKEGLK